MTMGGRLIPYCDDPYDPYYNYSADVLDGVEARSIEITALTGDNASVAAVDYDGLTAFGDAKRNKGERRNQSVGEDLAVGRAFINLGHQLIDRAQETLDCQEAK